MKIENGQNIQSIQPTGAPTTGSSPLTNERVGKGPSFQDTLTALQGLQTGNSARPSAGTLARSPGAIPGAVKFSNHAIERMQSRGISFSPQDIQRINEAVDKAAAKGSKDSLLLMDESALIVSVKNKTIVTVMDKATMKENVFTNIDSTIVM